MRLEIIDKDGARIPEVRAERCRQAACGAGLYVIDKIPEGESWSFVLADPVREIALLAAVQAIVDRDHGVRVSVMA